MTKFKVGEEVLVKGNILDICKVNKINNLNESEHILTSYLINLEHSDLLLEAKLVSIEEKYVISLNEHDPSSTDSDV